MKKLFTFVLMLTTFCGVSMADDVYRVAGDVSVLGSNWNVSDDNNKMTLCDDGIYRLVKEDVTLSAGQSFQFKVCKNESWDNGNYGYNNTSNAYYKVSKAGTYDVVFVFNPSGFTNGDNHYYVGCQVIGDDLKFFYKPSDGDWTVGETATYSDGEYSIEFTGTLDMSFALAPASDAADGISGDEWGRIIRPNTDGSYWQYIQHSSDKAIPLNNDKVWIVKEAATYTLYYYPAATYTTFALDAQKTESMGSAGWRTYSTGNYSNSNGYSITATTGSTVQAYYISATSGSKATLTPIEDGTVIRTQSGILLEGTGDFIVSTTSTTGDALTGNLLVGSGNTGVEVPENNFVFGYKNTNGIGFYKVDSEDRTLGAHKAYLAVSAEAREFIGFDNEATDINAIISHLNNDVFYNLKGQRIAQPQKGIYIVNGMKRIVK